MLASAAIGGRNDAVAEGGRLVQDLLTRGQRLQLEFSGAICTVERMLGAGGQGEVYEVTLENDDPRALKAYRSSFATEDQRVAIEQLLDYGSPSGRFLWPDDIVLEAGRFRGYVMPLRPEGYHGLADLVSMRRRVSFRNLATMGFHLADGFLALHARGLCYRDISFGNVFFEEANGSILICDNDNVGIDGDAYVTVKGTSLFMAPEIVRGEVLPHSRTDLHSLAVLLFILFMKHHPLQGKRESEYIDWNWEAMADLFGHRPVFIFDPDDDTNRPLPDHHAIVLNHWPIFPGFLHRTFEKAFTRGLHDPDARIAESTWKATMIRLRDCIFECSCGAEVFLDPDTGVVAGPEPGRCWHCGNEISPPPSLAIGRTTIVLARDTPIYAHHLGGNPFSFGDREAQVTTHPTNPSVLGLTNLTDATWVAAGTDGERHDVLPGRTVRLEDGLRIVFPRGEGLVRWDHDKESEVGHAGS